MAMEVNGPSILAAISNSPAAFAMTDAQVNTLATTALVARFKDRAVGLDQLKSIARSIGADDFRLALDHLMAKDTLALNKRLDPGNVEAKTAPESWHRQHIIRLAEGSVEPVLPTKKVPTKKPPPASLESKTGPVMGSKALKPKDPPKPTKSRSARK